MYIIFELILVKKIFSFLGHIFICFKFILSFRSHFFSTCECDYSHCQLLAVSPCFVEHQDESIFERVAIGYSKDYYEVGIA